MKIKYSKDNDWKRTIYESDIKRLHDGDSITIPSDYSSTWIEEDVTIEKLQEYVNKGYTIKINC